MLRVGGEESIDAYLAKSLSKTNLLFRCYVLVTDCNDTIFDECFKYAKKTRFFCDVGIENLSTEYTR